MLRSNIFESDLVEEIGEQMKVWAVCISGRALLHELLRADLPDHDGLEVGNGSGDLLCSRLQTWSNESVLTQRSSWNFYF